MCDALSYLLVQVVRGPCDCALCLCFASAFCVGASSQCGCTPCQCVAHVKGAPHKSERMGDPGPVLVCACVFVFVAYRAYIGGTSAPQGSMKERKQLVCVCVSHRIDTIMDTDKLLVLNSGQLVEQGPPKELAARKGGLFASFVAAAHAAHTQPPPAATATQTQQQ